MDLVCLQLSRMLDKIADAEDVGVTSHNRLHNIANILLRGAQRYEKDRDDKWLRNLIVDSEEIH